MARSSSVPTPPRMIWFWLALFACFGLATSLSCMICKPPDPQNECKETENKECNFGGHPPPPNQREACFGHESPDYNYTRRECAHANITRKPGCEPTGNSGTAKDCYCYTDNCDALVAVDTDPDPGAGGGGKGPGTKPTPWRNILWIGGALACLFPIILKKRL